MRTERLNNFANPSAFVEQRPDDVAFLNEQGLHGDIYRNWLDDDADEGTAHDDLCDVETNTCDFSLVADYMRDASKVSDSLLIVPMTRTMIEEKRPPAEAKPQLKMILKGLKERYPRIEYVEAFNEPDWHFHGSQLRAGSEPILQPEELYPYYVPVYEAVNEINEELRPDVPLKVGGPAFASFSKRWLGAFLDAYQADTNPMKRLDFISWHGYGEFNDDFSSFHTYKQNPSEVSTKRAELDEMLKSRGIGTDVPTFITETGVYPGPSFDDPSGTTDYARQAAGVASIHYWFANQANTFPFQWVVRHGSEGRKDQLVTRMLPGQDPPTGIFTPYGNMMLMQSKMKATKVPAVSDSLEAGQGVYAVASKDETGAAVMTWNYQHTNNGSFQATIDMANLPGHLRDKPVRQRMFRIDQTTSNFFIDPQNYITPDPETANLQQVDEEVVTPGKTYTETIDLEPNAIYLILLEPAP